MTSVERPGTDLDRCQKARKPVGGLRFRSTLANGLVQTGVWTRDRVAAGKRRALILGAHKAERLALSYIEPKHHTQGRAAKAQPLIYDEDIPDYGVVPVVEHFLPGIDRLLLDFDDDAVLPRVTLNLTLEHGSTAVFGDGRLMAILRRVTQVSTRDIELRRAAPEHVPMDLSQLSIIENFDSRHQEIEVHFDPGGAPPKIDVVDLTDQSGTLICFNGTPIAAVRGTHGLDTGDVTLVPRLMK